LQAGYGCRLVTRRLPVGYNAVTVVTRLFDAATVNSFLAVELVFIIHPFISVSKRQWPDFSGQYTRATGRFESDMKGLMTTIIQAPLKDNDNKWRSPKEEKQTKLLPTMQHEKRSCSRQYPQHSTTQQ
jgi:hypothetical protein